LASAGSIGLGLLLCFGLPVLAMLALATVVGIPIPGGLVWFAGDDDLAAGVALLQVVEGVGVSRSG
jgi:hypothetical protein